MQTEIRFEGSPEEATAAIREENERYRQENGTGKKAYVLTFGCQQNEADSERLAGMADAMGYTVQTVAAGADLVIVNTCAVREHAEQRALSLIGQFKHMKAQNPAMVLCVCGCMVAQEHRAEELKKKYPYVDFTFAPALIGRFPQMLLDYMQNRRRRFYPENGYTEITEGMPVIRESGYRAWVSIMYGCNNFCSYCIVPYVRGRERSRAWECVYREVEELVREGYRDITLLGQNVNSYRGGISFAELLRKLAGIEGDFQIRFMTSHPKDASDALIAAMAECPKIAPHFHLPMQSGSDRILKVMNRHYDSARYESIVKKLRAAVPGVALTTDIIVGFPGETEEDFEATLEMVKKCRFDMIYSFLYSPRKFTPAAEMAETVPDSVKSERFARLIHLQNEISRENNEAYVGRTVRVLCDGRGDGEAHTSGRTDTNKIVHFDADIPAGEWVTLEIVSAETFALFGKIKE